LRGVFIIAGTSRGKGTKGTIKKPESDLNLKSKKKPAKKTAPVLEPKEVETFKCCACGDKFTDQTKSFPFSQSAFFKGNNNRLPICNNCFNSSTDQYTELLGSQDDAIKRMCLHWDIYVDEKTLESTKKIDAGRSRIKEYVRQQNLNQNAGKSYDTYLKELQDNSIGSIEKLEELRVQGKTNISNVAVERWSTTFSESDIKTLEEHYKMLKKQNPNCDSNQEIFIKDLCYTKLQQMKVMTGNNVDDFGKLTKLYRETFKQAGLKTVQDVDSSNDETLGVTLEVISKYTPEEYYKDKKLYKDFDGLGEYITRFLLRPLKNLQHGTKDRDDEFKVKDSDEYDEE
jgi:hypothetical protein